ncbi:hypothetical protein UlMin_045598 [Ulmus minor]
MVDSPITSSRYIYVHDRKWLPEAADVHHIVARKNGSKDLLLYFWVLLFLAHGFYLLLVEDSSIIVVLLSSLLGAFFLKLLRNPVKKESVVVMPAFGVQLETHYVSGRVIRRFIPVDKILKPVLLECVTPVTCYWSLSLIVCGEAELVSVFKGFHPPAKMLIPIWKVLCVATNSGESSDASAED